MQKKPTRKKTQKARPKSARQGTPRSNPKSNLKSKKSRYTAISSDWPLWYDPLSPLGSAVRHVASLSPRFHWVGIYELKGKLLKLGPYLGAPTEHTSIPVGKGVCGTAVLENKDQNVPDVQTCSNYLACSVETKSELVVLIRDRGGRILGQIDIDSHVPRAFGQEEHEAVGQVAKELGELWPAQKSRN